jgi:hypothetical protein
MYIFIIDASMSQYVKAAAASLEDTISYNAESRENALEVYLWV